MNLLQNSVGVSFFIYPVNYLCNIVDNDRNVYWPSQQKLFNTPTTSQQRGKTPRTSALHMTLNNLMVRFQ